MDFGAIPHLTQTVFEMAPLDPRNQNQSHLTPSASHWAIGCPVWGCPEWEGSLYPQGCRPSEYLYYYSRQFRSIELNSTFYRTPTPSITERWIEQTPPDFTFCPKIHRSLSHEPTGVEARQELPQVISFLKRLRESGRLGLPFLQLPPHFDPSKIKILEQLLDVFCEVHPVAVEFRHPGWFYNRVLIGRAFELLTRLSCPTVITDTAGRRDVAHSSLTSDQVLVRFLGNAPHPSDSTRVQDWIHRIGEWESFGLRRVFFFIHQHNNADSPALLSQLIECLNAQGKTQIQAPSGVGQIGLF